MTHTIEVTKAELYEIHNDCDVIEEVIDGDNFFNITVESIFIVNFNGEEFNIIAYVQDMSYIDSNSVIPGIYSIPQDGGYFDAVCKYVGLTDEDAIERIKFYWIDYEDVGTIQAWIADDNEDALEVIKILNETLNKLNIAAEEIIYPEMIEKLKEEYSE